MPAETVIQEKATTPAFLGLQSYSEAQANSFFGRDAEIDNLAKLVLINTLTIVFGKSGTGKTSLLNAGVFPKLRDNYCLPFRIRLEFSENSPDLITQIKKVLKEQIDKYGFKVQSYPASETIWEYFHKEPLWKTVTPILVFDQFEEMFTLAKINPRFGASAMGLFWEELSNLIENTIPEKLKPAFLDEKEKITYNYKKQKTKIVFAFREEYLPEFETIATKIPSIKYSRFRLMPMNGYQAYDVITKTWKENINPSEARQIVSYLTDQSSQESYDLITVEPSLLSQVCAYIDEKRLAEGSNKVSAELLKKYPKETILRSIYEEAVHAAGMAINPGATAEAEIKKNRIKEFLEDHLITTQGYRAKYNISEKDNWIRPGIGVLQSKYIIREDDNVVELTHDVLAPIIKSDREERERKAAFSARLKKTLKRFFILAGLSLLVALGFAISAYFANKKRIDAVEKKDSALAEKQRLDGVIITLKNDSARMYNGKQVFGKPSAADLHKLEDSMRALTSQVNRLEDSIAKLQSGQPVTGNMDFTALRTEIEKLRQDSINKTTELNTIKNENQRLIGENKKQITEKTKLMSDNAELISNNTRLVQKNSNLSADNSRLITENKKLNSDNTVLLEEISRLKGDNDLKSRTIKELELQLRTCCKSVTTIDKTSSIQLSIYYKKNQKNYPGVSPESIHVYLIPFKGNASIIEKASDYYTYNEAELEKAKGRIKAKYNRDDGDYYFENITEEGKYLLKVCTLYGPYQEYELKKGGNPHIKIDAAPPVK